ncbi:hypothetical protein ACTXT7_017478 [Hymenolepis weldensis]
MSHFRSWSPCHAEIRFRLLSLLDKKPDIERSCCRPKSPERLSSHSQNANFAENVVIIEIVLSKMLLPELQRQWPPRRLLPRIFYEQFYEAEPEQKQQQQH